MIGGGSGGGGARGGSSGASGGGSSGGGASGGAAGGAAATTSARRRTGGPCSQVLAAAAAAAAAVTAGVSDVAAGGDVEARVGEVAPAIRRALSVPIPTTLSVPELRDLARAVASAQLGIVAAMEEDDVRGSGRARCNIGRHCITP